MARLSLGDPAFQTQKTLEAKLLTKSTKIMVQMNCKGLGAPWTVDLKMEKLTYVLPHGQKSELDLQAGMRQIVRLIVRCVVRCSD